MLSTYDVLLEKISRQSNVAKEELERRVEAKRSKLSGLISKEGAIQIIAAELGVSFENQRIYLNEIVAGMKRARVVGKVMQVFPVRTFNKNGKSGKVATLLIADDTSNARVVLWDTNHIDLVEKGKINAGDTLEIFNASIRDHEIHLNSFSEIKPSTETIANPQMQQNIIEKKISEANIGESFQTRSFIVHVFDPTFFSVCPSCKKRVIFEDGKSNCGEHGVVEAEQRNLCNFVIDDGSDNIRAVAFHEQLSQLGISVPLQPENVFSLKQELLGKEFLFVGDLRSNKIFKNPEFIIRSVNPLVIDSLLQSIEHP